MSRSITPRLYGQGIERPALHQHAACMARGHWCRCAGLKAFECQRCTSERFNRQQLAAWRAKYPESK